MKCPIHHCDLVCPQCLAIERGRKGGTARTKAKQRASAENGLARASRPKKNIYKLSDCLAAFTTAHTALSIHELIDAASPEKRLHAQKVIYRRLNQLKKQGKIIAIGWGRYQLQE